jgi:hypothetical protein
MGQKKYLTRANKQRAETLHLLVEKQPHYRKQKKIKHKKIQHLVLKGLEMCRTPMED